MDPVTVGGFVLSAFLQVLFDRVASRAVLDFFRAKKLDAGLLRKLKITLLAVNKVLYDAEERQITDKPVKDWLEELQDAIYDAEDLLDAVNTKSMQQHNKAKLKLKVRNIFKCLHSSDGDMETQLKEILVRLEEIVEQRDVLGLKERVGVEEMQNKRLPTTSLVEEDSVYGRNDEKESIVKLLLDEHSSDSLGVITIKGMGGIGKTTLAQLVYNDEKIVKHFDFKAWVYISEEFEVFKVTKMILEAVTSSTSTTNNPDLLQVELKDKLADKKFLLVLDDVWNEDQSRWEMLRRPLQHGARGSKILVTTRNEGVARIMRTVPTYDLKKLSEEDCWMLFAKYAFEGEESRSRPGIEEVGREIVKRCDGLPLAAKALGGILRYKATTEEWIRVKESNLWDLKDENCNILPVLRVSYHYLPSHLKPCFAFSSIFPKDYEFDKDELILLWAAQSFLPEMEGGENMIEVGAGYFNELISRSFFKRSNANESYFVMHDLIHDLATFVSGQSCRCMNRDGAQIVAKKTRHMSYFRMRLKQFDNLPVENHLRTLVQLELDKTNRSRVPHSFYRYPEKVPNNLLTKFKFLRVLSLCEYDIWELPNSIGSLKHLRYLDLSKTNISRLPDSICDLYNLQTLILRSVWELTKLPKNICKLVNLLYLDITGCLYLEKMPRNLDKLRSLTRLKLECDGASIRELGPLWNLHGECLINNLQNVVSSADAAEARLNDKKYIETLLLSWDSELNGPRKEYEVLENLQPHKSLKVLSIENYGDARLPNWIGSRLYSNIVLINLEKCKYCQSIPTLGQLPSLKELRICGFDGLQKLDSEFYGSSLAAKPFGSLVSLEIEDMPQWEEWFHCDGEVFPLVQQLWIKNCPKLRRNLPPRMRSLTELEVHGCPQLAVSLPMAPALSYLYLCSSNEMLLNNFPEGLQQLKIEQYEELQSLPEGLTQISKTLQTMTRCSSSTSLPQAVSSCTLKSLEIKCCQKVEMRTDREYASLENLTISDSCDSLQSFPLQCFPKLKALAISGCKNFESLLPNGAGPEFPSLTQLEIVSCSKFQNFPDEGLPFPNLRLFTFQDNEMAMRLPNRMLSLQCLEHLTVTSCSGIESLPKDGFPSTLTSLDISGCDKFVAELFDWGLRGLKSLIHLRLSGRFQGISSFPEKRDVARNY